MPRVGSSFILIIALAITIAGFYGVVTEAPVYQCLLSGVRTVALIWAGMACRVALAEDRYAVPARGWLLLTFLFCVSVGDFIYTYGVGLERYPRNIIGDFAFGSGFVSMAILMALYLRDNLSRKAWGFVLAIAALALLGQWVFVLEPAELQHAVPFASLVSVAAYSLATSLLIGLAAVGSVKSFGLFDVYVTHLFLVYASFDFACRYEAVINPNVSTNGALIGWSFSISAMAWLVIVQTGKANQPFDGQAEMRPLASVRGWAGVCAAVSLIFVMVLLIKLRLLRVEGAFQATSLLSVTCGVYMLLNLASVSLSNSLVSLSSVTPVVCDNRVGGYFREAVAWRPDVLLELRSMKQARELPQASEGHARAHLQVAHDIRSPIAALKALLPSMPDPGHEGTALYAQAVERLDAISADLLRHKRSASRESTPELQWQAADLIEDLVTEKRVVYRSKRIRYDCTTVDSHLHACVKLSKADLSRVLSNVLNNAIEASSEDGAVCIALRENADGITIAVRDNGCGMEREILDKVRRGLITHGKADGHGLGISGALRILQRVGGSLEIESEPTVGTCVFISIPKDRVSE